MIFIVCRGRTIRSIGPAQSGAFAQLLQFVFDSFRRRLLSFRQGSGLSQAAGQNRERALMDEIRIAGGPLG
jgi:hypothetical protein